MELGKFKRAFGSIWEIFSLCPTRVGMNPVLTYLGTEFFLCPTCVGISNFIKKHLAVRKKKIVLVDGHKVTLRKGESARADGIFIYQFTDSTGKRRSVSSTNLETLRHKELEVQADVLGGIRTDKKRLRLNELTAEFFQTKMGLCGNTEYNYKWLYNAYVANNQLGKTPICEITHGTILRHYKGLIESGKLSLSTVSGLQNVLFQIFDYAITEKIFNLVQIHVPVQLKPSVKHLIPAKKFWHSLLKK